MVNKKTALPIFGNKEDANFREAMKLYDALQFKKALKIVDANLKKNSSHAESLALKGCLNFQLGNKSEAESYILRAVGKIGSAGTAGADNYLVNHLAAIYYRQTQNYVESAKWMKASRDNGSPNKGMLRDLAYLQSQVRDYKNLVDSRQQYLEFQPGYRANWTGLAVAHHLNKDHKGAIATLSKIEGIIRQHLTDADRYEHSECLLYKNQLLAEIGDPAKALEALEADNHEISDKCAYLEYKAKYLLLLGQDASLCYRELLQRNPDNVHYYNMLEVSLGTLGKSPDIRLGLYDKLAKFYPRSDPPKFLPLLFLPASHEQFKQRVRTYMVTHLKRGVPATFVNLKPIYRDKLKLGVIEELALEFYANVEEFKGNPTIKLWTQYYLAQHYLYLNDLNSATKYIDAAITHSPTLVELYVIKARILKHENKLVEAAKAMNEGRELDLQDRFINSKATKYLLRSDQVNEAVDCISLFTKLDEDEVNGCKDLHTMQNNWVLIESAEAYYRLYLDNKKKLEEVTKKETEDEDNEELEDLTELTEIYRGLALKRFRSLVKIFEIFFIDQFDFHSYCLRRGTPRDYIALLKWEDKLHATPIYTRVIKGLSQMYFELFEEQKLGEKLFKKASNKQKKKKAKATKKRAELISKVESEKEDADPLGAKLLADLAGSKDIIEQLYTLVKPMGDEAPELKCSGDILFKIYLAQGKYVLALQAVKRLDKLVGRSYALLKLGELEKLLAADADVNVAIVKVVGKAIASAFPEYKSEEGVEKLAL